MIKCPECGTEVAENVADCPYCGYHLIQTPEPDISEPAIETVEEAHQSEIKPLKKRRWPVLAALILAVAYMITAFTGAFNVPTLQFLIFWRDTPDKVVCQAIDSLKADDWPTARSYWGQDRFNTDSNGTSLDSDSMLKLIFQNLNYKVEKTEISKKNATVTVSVSNSNMGQIMPEAFQSMYRNAVAGVFSGIATTSNEMISEVSTDVSTRVNQKNVPITTKEIEVNLVLTDGKWKVQSNDSVVDALMGGFNTAMTRIQSVLSGF